MGFWNTVWFKLTGLELIKWQGRLSLLNNNKMTKAKAAPAAAATTLSSSMWRHSIWNVLFEPFLCQFKQLYIYCDKEGSVVTAIYLRIYIAVWDVHMVDSEMY